MYYMHLKHIISTLLDIWLHKQNKYNMYYTYILYYIHLYKYSQTPREN